jgi:predicted CxxxxCH...CXXCH cytochrome family protein
LTPWTACSIGSCHSNGSNTNYPVTAGTAPDCTSCHKNGLKTPSGTSSCWDCHGATALDGRPNSNVFPNWSGSHTVHVVNQSMTCSACHGANGGGLGDTRHGFSNRTAHTFAAGFVNVTSTTSKFHFTRTNSVTGTCSNIACHSGGIQWGGGTKLGCNSCHAYDTTDSGTTWLPNLFIAGGSGAGAHVKHINFIKVRLAIASLTPTGRTFGAGEPAAICGTCHTNLPTDHTMNSIGTRNINFGSGTYTMGSGSMSLVFGSNPSFDSGLHSCSNVSCHYFATPNWY